MSIEASENKPPPQQPGEWYLSFDCATKSFAFALLKICAPPFDALARTNELTQYIAQKRYGDALHVAKELEVETRKCFQLLGGGTADLAPGTKNNELPTVTRIRVLRAYLDTVVSRVLSDAAAGGCPSVQSPKLNVAVEWQMGANVPARAVATALITYYSTANVFLVGPAYKNKLWFPSRPELRLCHFIEKYSTLYTANKNHSKCLYFDHLAKIFGHTGSETLKTIPKRFQKDFADCVLQVLGFRAFGDIENASLKF